MNSVNISFEILCSVTLSIKVKIFLIIRTMFSKNASFPEKAKVFLCKQNQTLKTSAFRNTFLSTTVHMLKLKSEKEAHTSNISAQVHSATTFSKGLMFPWAPFDCSPSLIYQPSHILRLHDALGDASDNLTPSSNVLRLHFPSSSLTPLPLLHRLQDRLPDFPSSQGFFGFCLS